MRHHCFLLLALSAISGCGGTAVTEEEVPPVPVVQDEEPAPKAESSSLPAAGGWRKYDGVSFEIPDTWRAIEAQMVDSKYVMPTDDGDIEITLTAMGGGVTANLERWAKQVQQAAGDSPIEDVITLDGVDAKIVDVTGKFNSRVGTQQVASNSRLIGVALPIRPRDFYVKLVGPRDAVASYYDDFRAFLKTAKVETE